MADTTNTTGTVRRRSETFSLRRYPAWDGAADFFENWLLTITARLRDPGMRPYRTTLFSRIPSARQAECSAYIQARIPDGASLVDGVPR
ncbi:hypothetical protein E4U48_007261 [Claviceps purpurea]|nr:hypothetical protein E4U48_007261 [Claviceps purpurea]